MALPIRAHAHAPHSADALVGGTSHTPPTPTYTPQSNCSHLQRLYAPVGTLARGKVAAMAEAVADCHECLPPLSLLPHWEHFYPTRHGQPVTVMMTACSIIPKAEQVRTASAKQRQSIRTDQSLLHADDTPRRTRVLGPLHAQAFCPARDAGERCYGVRLHTYSFKQNVLLIVVTCSRTLGPGASNLIPKMTDPSLPEEQRVDVSKSPRKLELREWQILVNAFKNWPFRPTVCLRTLFVSLVPLC